jgi:hypothetical protein
VSKPRRRSAQDRHPKNSFAIEAGAAILAEHEAGTDLLETIGSFHRRLMPRAEKANIA